MLYSLKLSVIIINRKKAERGDKMITVQVKNGELDKALRKFKQRVAKSGLPSEVKKKREYIKPGVEKRNAKKEAQRKAGKAARRERNAA